MLMNSRLKFASGLVLVVLFITGYVFGQQSPNQPPPNLPNPGVLVDPHTIEVTNIGNKTLNFAYWDGESAWRTVKLLPTQGTTITCEACGNTINIAYHDGREARSVRARPGKRYVLSWLGSENRWNFGPSQ
jgi:hypothetical protein